MCSCVPYEKHANASADIEGKTKKTEECDPPPFAEIDDVAILKYDRNEDGASVVT